MLNIISQSIYNKKTRGPKKVVDNLIKGLDQLGYPYVINKQLNCCKRLWIHDDTLALEKITTLPGDVKIIVGPNLFINPENIPKNLNLSKTIYLHPSLIVKNIWEKRGYKSKIAVWPAGIDTEKYIPSLNKKDMVLIYFKNREKEELEKIQIVLNKKNINHKVITYGLYQEYEYEEILKKTKYIIWLGTYESQGIALEEALSCNIPILVIDNETPTSSFDTESTSAPYFDNRCGIKIKGFDNFNESLNTIEKDLLLYKPREYILENLTLKKQAYELLKLYEDNFNYKIEDGLKEINNDRSDYKVNIIKRYYNKIYEKIFNI